MSGSLERATKTALRIYIPAITVVIVAGAAG
jgi:hypothetical protein